MRVRRLHQLFLVCLLLSASAVHGHQPHGIDPASAADLIAMLQRGGNIIYLRHAATNHNKRDVERGNLDDCSKQRNLSAGGKIQATNIGRGIRDRGIPIGKVFSSPYCRCRDTARLAFGDYMPDPDLQFSISKEQAEADRLGRRLHEMMMSADTATNTVFVGHSANLRDGLGVWPKPEGVMVIFRKHADGIELQGMIHPDYWRREPSAGNN